MNSTTEGQFKTTTEGPSSNLLCIMEMKKEDKEEEVDLEDLINCNQEKTWGKNEYTSVLIGQLSVIENKEKNLNFQKINNEWSSNFDQSLHGSQGKSKDSLLIQKFVR